MKKMLFLSVLLIFILVFFTGCSNQDEAKSLESKQTNEQTIQVKNSSPSELKNLTNTEIATHLSKIASSIPEVKSATSVVVGPYAVVGIDVDEDLDRSKVGVIKYTVLEALYHDPYGKTAVVVADADVTERIRGIAEKIRQGQPVQGFVDEISTIVARYMPDFPIRENTPEETDENMEQLPQGNKDDLRKIQDEQSNYHLNKNE